MQDNFYEYITKCGFNLERGNKKDNEHIPIEKLKLVTNYELQELEKNSLQIEEEIITNNFEELKKDYRRIIKKYNILAKQYTRVKTITNNTISKQEILEKENERLEKENNKLKNYIEKTFQCVSLLFDFSKERLKSLVDTFVKDLDGKISK